MSETQTAPVAAKTEAPRQTIAEKVEILTAEKTEKTNQLASMAADAPERAGIETRIQEIDRKIRWYQGRSGDGSTKASSPKADRPSKAASSKGSKSKAQTSATAAEPTAPVTAASES